MKVHHVFKSPRGPGAIIHDREWDENEPNAALSIPSADGLRFDPEYTDYVSISQEDNNDEYYHQTLVIRKQDIPAVISFLQSFLDNQS